MRGTLASVFLAVVMATAGAAATFAASGPELEGVYAAAGVNPDGSEYRGLVHIVRHGESFVVSWMFPRVSGEEVVFETVSVGIGIASTGMLAVSYFTARMAGVVLYQIGDGGNRLAGHWTVVGEGGALQTETLTRLPGQAPQPVEADPSPESTPKRQVPAGAGKSFSL
jgi:hypothetical protein